MLFRLLEGIGTAAFGPAAQAFVADITTGAGAALMLVGAGILVFWPSEAPVQPAVGITPNSAAIAFSGSF